MTLIDANEHMNLQNWYRKQGLVAIVWLILITFSTIILPSCRNQPSPVVVQKQKDNIKQTFAYWCREKKFLNPEAKHTVEVLLKKVNTTECDVASQKLSALTALNLSSNEISDIKPLVSLTNLKNLSLYNNQIRDIKTLTSLTNLTVLSLGGNKITDIKSLAFLTNLKDLDITINEIIDIKPLKSLTNLTELSLDANKITNIKPL